MRTVDLRTPTLRRFVPDGVFDAYAWAPGTALRWKSPGASITDNPLNDELPLRMAFVLYAPWDQIPTELAWLHTGRDQAEALGLRDEVAMAPYAIDDATDQLYAHGRLPTETFWLATDNLNALFWALHDWAHFHNHGPFDDRPATELQCDALALAWLWSNRDAVPLTEARWERLREEVLANHLRLRELEPVTRAPEPEALRSRESLGRLLGAW